MRVFKWKSRSFFFINSRKLGGDFARTRRNNIDRARVARCHGSKPPAERSDSQSAFFFTFRKIDSILVVTSRVIRLPWSILASACRSNGRCAIERSSSRKPSLTEFRVRDARATSVPPHITTAIATDAHCQRPSGRLDQYFPVLRLVYRFDYSHETGRHSRFYYREKGKEENAFALEISRYRNRSCRVFFLDFSVSSFSPGARTYMRHVPRLREMLKCS